MCVNPQNPSFRQVPSTYLPTYLPLLTLGFKVPSLVIGCLGSVSSLALCVESLWSSLSSLGGACECICCAFFRFVFALLGFWIAALVPSTFYSLASLFSFLFPPPPFFCVLQEWSLQRFWVVFLSLLVLFSGLWLRLLCEDEGEGTAWQGKW
jgi:hypothetical protein